MVLLWTLHWFWVQFVWFGLYVAMGALILLALFFIFVVFDNWEHFNEGVRTFIAVLSIVIVLAAKPSMEFLYGLTLEAYGELREEEKRWKYQREHRAENQKKEEFAKTPIGQLEQRLVKLNNMAKDLKEQKQTNQNGIEVFYADVNKLKAKLDDFRRKNLQISTHKEAVQHTESRYILENLAKAMTYLGVLERKQPALENYLTSINGKIEGAELDLKFSKFSDNAKVLELIKEIDEITEKYNKNDFILDENKVTKLTTKEVWDALNN